MFWRSKKASRADRNGGGVRRIEAARPGVQSFNFGIPGFAIDQMWQTLEHVALPLEPHLVVLNFILDDMKRSEDFHRFREGWVEKPTFVLSGGRLAPMTADLAPSGLMQWIKRNLHLVEAGARLLDRLSMSTPITLGRRWNLNMKLFQAIRDSCRKAGIPLIVMYIPPVERWAPVASFKRAFQDMDIPYLDLALEATGDHRRLFFPKDRHLNREGHKMVHEVLERVLSRYRF